MYTQVSGFTVPYVKHKFHHTKNCSISNRGCVVYRLQTLAKIYLFISVLSMQAGFQLIGVL